MIASFFLLYLKSVLTCDGSNDIINSGGVMKNKKFSFVKWLTNRDVEKLVEKLGYEIMNKKDDPDKKRISRFTDKDGYKHISVFCKDLISMEAEGEMYKALSKNKSFGNMMRKVGAVYSMLGAIAGGSDYSYPYSYSSNFIWLDITDFLVLENMSLKKEEDNVENARRMTKIYQDYMSKKFGRFYNGMRNADIKRTYKEAREEEAKNKEAEQTKENNEETMEK